MKDWVAHGRKMRTMTWAEFHEWMQDKTLYFTQTYWKEKWCGDDWKNGKPQLVDDHAPFIPVGAFVLPDTTPLARNPYYPWKGALGNKTIDGRNYWECEGCCRVSYNSGNRRVLLTFEREKKSESALVR